MQVFRVTDCDWFAAESAEQARDAAIAFMGDDDCIYPVDEVEPVAEWGMQNFTIHNEDDGKTRTFKEELDHLLESGVVFPLHFASTEY